MASRSAPGLPLPDKVIRGLNLDTSGRTAAQLAAILQQEEEELRLSGVDPAALSMLERRKRTTQRQSARFVPADIPETFSCYENPEHYDEEVKILKEKYQSGIYTADKLRFKLREVQDRLDAHHKRIKASVKRSAMRRLEEEKAGKVRRGHNELAQLLYSFKDDKEQLFIEATPNKETTTMLFLEPDEMDARYFGINICSWRILVHFGSKRPFPDCAAPGKEEISLVKNIFQNIPDDLFTEMLKRTDEFNVPIQCSQCEFPHLFMKEVMFPTLDKFLASNHSQGACALFRRSANRALKHEKMMLLFGDFDSRQRATMVQQEAAEEAEDEAGDTGKAADDKSDSSSSSGDTDAYSDSDSEYSGYDSSKANLALFTQLGKEVNSSKRVFLFQKMGEDLVASSIITQDEFREATRGMLKHTMEAYADYLVTADVTRLPKWEQCTATLIKKNRITRAYEILLKEDMTNLHGMMAELRRVKSISQVDNLVEKYGPFEPLVGRTVVLRAEYEKIMARLHSEPTPPDFDGEEGAGDDDDDQFNMYEKKGDGTFSLRGEVMYQLDKKKNCLVQYTDMEELLWDTIQEIGLDNEYDTNRLGGMIHYCITSDTTDLDKFPDSRELIECTHDLWKECKQLIIRRENRNSEHTRCIVAKICMMHCFAKALEKRHDEDSMGCGEYDMGYGLCFNTAGYPCFSPDDPDDQLQVFYVKEYFQTLASIMEQGMGDDRAAQLIFERHCYSKALCKVSVKILIDMITELIKTDSDSPGAYIRCDSIGFDSDRLARESVFVWMVANGHPDVTTRAEFDKLIGYVDPSPLVIYAKPATRDVRFLFGPEKYSQPAPDNNLLIAGRQKTPADALKSASKVAPKHTRFDSDGEEIPDVDAAPPGVRPEVLAEVEARSHERDTAKKAFEASSKANPEVRADVSAKAAAKARTDAEALAAKEKARVDAEAKKADKAKAQADAKAARAKAQADAKEARAKAQADAKEARAKAQADAKEARAKAQADAQAARAKALADEEAARAKAAKAKPASKATLRSPRAEVETAPAPKRIKSALKASTAAPPAARAVPAAPGPAAAEPALIMRFLPEDVVKQLTPHMRKDFDDFLGIYMPIFPEIIILPDMRDDDRFGDAISAVLRQSKALNPASLLDRPNGKIDYTSIYYTSGASYLFTKWMQTHEEYRMYSQVIATYLFFCVVEKFIILNDLRMDRGLFSLNGFKKVLRHMNSEGEVDVDVTATGSRGSRSSAGRRATTPTRARRT